MALTKTTVGVANISSLSSTPNSTEGLTAAQLQALFDKTGSDLKTYINDTLTAEIDAEFTTLNSGWLGAGETWGFSSVDDPTGIITITGDKTTKYSNGMRIRFVNGGNTIYGIITGVTYSAPNTLLTFLHEIDPTDNLALYLMANSAITANYYSSMKVPYGFPAGCDKWTVKLVDTTTPVQNTPTQNTWYNLGTLYIDIPIGAWNVRYDAQTEHERSVAGYPSVYCALSSTNNSVSDADLQTQGFFFSAALASLVLSRDKTICLTSKTRYYLIAKTDQTDCTALKFRGSLSSTKIKAVCTYL